MFVSVVWMLFKVYKNYFLIVLVNKNGNYNLLKYGLLYRILNLGFSSCGLVKLFWVINLF